MSEAEGEGVPLFQPGAKEDLVKGLIDRQNHLVDKIEEKNTELIDIQECAVKAEEEIKKAVSERTRLMSKEVEVHAGRSVLTLELKKVTDSIAICESNLREEREEHGRGSD